MSRVGSNPTCSAMYIIPIWIIPYGVIFYRSDIMNWCKYDTLVKINPYTYPDYFQYIKGYIEKASGVEW